MTDIPRREIMKLILQREQESGFTGTPKFALNIRSQLTNEETANIKKYKMGKTMLYTNMQDKGSGLLGALSRAAMGIEITVDNLAVGRRIICKDILEMVAVEEQVKEACSTFKTILDAATTFGGDQVVEF